MKKFSLSERNFFVHVRHFKAFFSIIFSVKRFGYDFVFNCSQTKFVAIILVLLVFFMRFFA